MNRIVVAVAASMLLASAVGGQVEPPRKSKVGPRCQLALQSHAFTPEVLSALRGMEDKAQLYPVNYLSTSHFGPGFAVGNLAIGEIFDARDRRNYEVFQNYARTRPNRGSDDPLYADATAATEFLREYGYDLVLYYPDEFHPMFTRVHDTWMFVREEPDGSSTGRYYSAQVTGRKLALHGGVGMKPLGSRKDLPRVYIPDGRFFGDLAPGGPLPSGQHRQNKYRRVPADQATRDKRARDGHIPCPLSGHAPILVGAWEPDGAAREYVSDGFWFEPQRDQFTYGTHGFYVLPLDAEFWKEPELPLDGE